MCLYNLKQDYNLKEAGEAQVEMRTQKAIVEHICEPNDSFSSSTPSPFASLSSAASLFSTRRFPLFLLLLLSLFLLCLLILHLQLLLTNNRMMNRTA